MKTYGLPSFGAPPEYGQQPLSTGSYAPVNTDYFKTPVPLACPRRGFNPGERIRFVAMPVHGRERRFKIDLRQQPTGTVIFHFNPRFDQNQVVMNSTRDGNWLSEVRPAEFPFKHDKVTTIDFIAEPAAIRVHLDGKFFASFPARDDLRYVDQVVVDGDVQLHCITTNH